ncbi:MFS transporter [Modestobacter sp. KNN46-3]|uniref:MFS transporter n=1 Tax=Modestobacter sp. KNN46-3 TaxID=2711218 RepID=UPI0019D0A820|nr:MFS transporter [Modestobacter sp. KNN46-3]
MSAVDPAPSPAALEGPHPPVRQVAALVVLSISQLMVVLDGTIVNVALPAIAGGLRVDAAADLQWVITAYTVAFGGLLLLGGRLGDRFGRRQVFVTGAAVFAGASLLGGLATDLSALIAARALQGAGAALLAPTALALLTVVFPEGRQRHQALGVFCSLPRPAIPTGSGCSSTMRRASRPSAPRSTCSPPR